MADKERVILQVALDFVDLDRALKCAAEAVAGGADWLEAGTPLIKSEGLDAVRALREKFPAVAEHSAQRDDLRRRLLEDARVSLMEQRLSALRALASSSSPRPAAIVEASVVHGPSSVSRRSVLEYQCAHLPRVLL